MFVKCRHRRLCGDIASLRGHQGPFQRLGIILRYAISDGVQEPKRRLSRVVALFSGLSIPYRSLNGALLDTPSVFVHPTDKGLSLGMATFSQRPQEPHRHGIVPMRKGCLAILKGSREGE